MRHQHILVYIGLTLLAAPLGAQQTSQTTLVAPVEITNEHPITNEINIEVMTDSAMVANLNRNLEALRTQIAEGECNTCGGANTTTKIAVAVLLPVLVWIAWELRGIKNNSAGVPGERGKDGSDGVDGQDGKDGEHHHDRGRKDHDSESES